MPTGEDVPFRPAEILSVLLRHRVVFVVIGGFAATVHGSPFITWDVDITPEQSAANLDRLSQALTDLNAKVRTISDPDGLPFSHSGESLATAGAWNLTTPYGDFDISFVPNGTAGYDDLKRDAAEKEIDGVRVVVASLADVVRSKQAANRPKDQRVLPVLREILAEESAQRRANRRRRTET